MRGNDATEAPLDLKINWERGQWSSPLTISAAYGSENNGLAVGRDLGHALAIKTTPGALAFVAGDGKVTAADDGRLGAGLTSAFDLLAIARVEAERADGTVLLDELYAHDGGAGVEDELANEGGFVHGWKGEGLAA